MMIKEVLNISKSKLEKNKISSSLLEVEILLSAVFKKDKEYLFFNPNKEISIWQNFLFQRMLKKRLAGYSVAVIVGHKWFYGLDFFVNKNVLVPRPETELMVETVLEAIINYKLLIINLIDVGTGSGCIVVSLANELNKKKIEFNSYALDISRKALKVARKNSRKYNLDNCIKILYSDLLNIIDFKKLNGPIFITANLPYLTPEQIKNSPSIKKEPKMALESGKDGLNHYRRLFGQIKNKIRGIKFFLFCEIDESQATAFTKLVKQELPTAKLSIKKDLNGADRLAVLVI
ncbi:MAG: peptide chain release factor N(5)-glutamine methyltransferase [Patescibacteria group bacterium]|jgi:release factor glutamine methyltransferase